MDKSVGSNSNVPNAPRGADTSTPPVSDKLGPDTSTNPPFPPNRPPRAASVPAMVVVPPDTTEIRPPLPLDPAFAEIEPLRATVALPVAFTATDPPPSAEICPVISNDPPMLAMETVPDLLAEIVPPADTRFCTTPSAARAVSCTVPPAARMTPVLVTSAAAPSGACVTCLVTFTDTSPSPYKSSVTARAPASTTFPIRASIVPLFDTLGATSAARPAPFTVIVPWFDTRAFGFAA